MKRWSLRVLVSFLAVLAPAFIAAAQDFVWTISNSIEDPLSNTGPIGPGPSMFAGNLYLWLYCATPSGFGAAEIDVVELAGGGPPTGFRPMNGFVNAAGRPT